MFICVGNGQIIYIFNYVRVQPSTTQLVNVALLVRRLKIMEMPQDLIRLIREWIVGRTFYIQVGDDCSALFDSETPQNSEHSNSCDIKMSILNWCFSADEFDNKPLLKSKNIYKLFY